MTLTEQCQALVTLAEQIERSTVKQESPLLANSVVHRCKLHDLRRALWHVTDEVDAELRKDSSLHVVDDVLAARDWKEEPI